MNKLYTAETLTEKNAADTHTTGTKASVAKPPILYKFKYQYMKTGFNRLMAVAFAAVLVFVSGTAMAQTTYYSKAAATDFNDVNSWGTATNGTGAAPASISNVDNFVVGNGSSMTLSATANVRALYIGSFTGFTPATATGSLTVIGGNTINVGGATGNNYRLGIGTSGTFTVSGGNINVKGDFRQTAGILNQSGGTISIDGNDAGSAATSVASGTAIFYTAVSGNSLTGGSIIIVDPHANTTASLAFSYDNSSTNFNAGTNHTFQFGDGASTNPGGNAVGFSIDNWTGSNRFAFGNLTIQGSPSGANRICTIKFTGSTPAVDGNLTITANGDLQTSTTTFSVAGNITNAGNLLIDGVLALRRYQNATASASTTSQTISGSGTFKNAASSTANFAGLTIQNSNATGVTFSNANSMISGANTGTVSGALTFTAGIVNTGGNPFVLGTGTGALGSYTWTAGGFGSGSMFGKWFAAATGGSAITASIIPATSTNTGFYPFINGTNSRQFFIERPTTAGSTGGVIRVLYSEGAGGLISITPDVPDASPTYNINRQSTASWTVSTSNGFAAGTGTFKYAASGTGIYSPLTATARLMLSASVTGTYQAGTTLPHAQRIAISAANFANQFYIGVNSADVPVTSAQTGPWETGSTWVGGVAPTSGQTAIILSTHNVTVSASTGSTTVTGVQVNSGGTLTITGGALTVGATNFNNVFTNSGTLSISAGALNINGNLNSATGSTFSQTGGTITVDGNDNNASVTSVATGTPIVHIQTNTVTMSAGSLIIVDPHVGSAAADDAFRYTSSSNASATTGHTLQIGNGASTQAGGNATNGFSLHPQAGTGLLLFGNITIDAVNNTGNRFVATRNTSTAGLAALGALTITTGEARILTSTTFTVAGNVANSGTLTTAGTLALQSITGTSPAASANAQTVSGGGTFQNLTSSATANFTNLTINNSNATGVTFSGSTWNNIASTVNSTLTITAGRINIGASSTLTLGTAAATAGTLSWTAGGFTQGTFKRWIGTGVISIGGIGGTYPFVSSANDNRNYYLGTTGGLTVGGTYSVTYVDGAGTTTLGSSFTDNGATITKVSNATWAVSQSALSPAGNALLMRIRGDGITALASTSGIRITGATASIFTGATSGAGSGTTTNPEANKATTTVNNVTGSPTTLYFGTGTTFTTAQSGNWEDGGTWVGGSSPGAGCSDVVINANHTVTVNASAASCTLLQISALGAVTVSGSSLTVGCTNNNNTLNNNGTLTVSGGNLNVNGNIAINNGSSFTHSSGTITIDGNDNSGTTGNANSVASGTPLFAIGTSGTSYSTGTISLTGGTIVIVDPHIGSATASNAYAVYANMATSVFANASTSHTFQFGNGVSTAAGSSTSGFVYEGFIGNGRLNFGNLTVNSAAGTNRNVTQLSFTNVVNGNLTVTQGTISIGTLTMNLGGNISVATGGNFITGTGSTTGTVVFCSTTGITTSAQTVAQSVSISGTGTINSNSAAPTANFVNITLNNTSSTGVTFNALNNNSGAAGFIGASVLNSITFTAGRATTTGANALLFGTSSARGTGSITVTAGGMTPGSTFAGGMSSVQSGTTITSAIVPTSFTGGYPFVDASGNARHVFIQRVTAAAAGIIAVKYTDGTGSSIVNITDATPSYTVNRQFNGKWTVSTFGTTPSATSFTMAISATGAFGGTMVANYPRITAAATPVGTNQAGTTLPHGQRTGLTLATLTAQDFYIGANNADLSQASFQSGPWEDAATWINNSVPTNLSNPVILNTHNVTVNAAAAFGNNLTINSGGALVVSGNTLTLSGTLANAGTVTASAGNLNITAASTTGITNTGTFTVSGGTVGLSSAGLNNRTFTNAANGSLSITSGNLNVFGNVLIANSSNLSISGGAINVDGNNGGSPTNSVATGTPIFSIGTSGTTYSTGTINLTGGSIVIVDPHIASTSDNSFTYYGAAIPANNITPGINFNLQFGNGSSNDAGTTSGFRYDQWETVGGIKPSLVINTGNGSNAATRFVQSVYSPIAIQNLSVLSGEFVAATSTNIEGNLSVVSPGIFTASTTVALASGIFASSTTLTSNVTTNAQTLSGNGTFRNSASSPTANFNDLTINNSNVAGVSLGTPISVSGATTLTQGILNINGQTLTLSGAVTGTGTLTGSAASNLNINGAATTVNFTPGGTNNYLKDLNIGASGSMTIGSNGLNIAAGATPGTVTITSGGSLATTSGNLTLKSDASGTARVAANTSVSSYITGSNVTVERYLPRRPGTSGKAWRLLTAPVTGTTIGAAWQDGKNLWNGTNPGDGVTGRGTLITGFQQVNAGTANGNGYDFWSGIAYATSSIRYHSAGLGVSGASGDWLTYTSILGKSINDKQGYLLYVRGDRSITTETVNNATTLSATGTLKQGGYGPALLAKNTSQFTLIGNPYASPVDFESILQNNGGPSMGKILDRFTIWDANLNTTGGYALVERVSGTSYNVTPKPSGSPTLSTTAQYIQSSQAFFVEERNDASNQTLNIVETDKSASGNNSVFFQDGSDNSTDMAAAKGRAGEASLNINLNIKNADNTVLLADGALLTIGAKYNKAVTGEDARKAYNFSENLAIAVDTFNLISERRPPLGKVDTVFLKLWGTGIKNYQFDIWSSSLKGRSANLVDKYLGTSTPLNLDGSVNSIGFSITSDVASKDINRFYIVTPGTGAAIIAGDMNGEESAATKGSVGMKVYPNPATGSRVNVLMSNLPKGIYELSAFTLKGTKMLTRKIEHTGGNLTESITLANWSAGVYTLQLTDADGKIVKTVSVVVSR